MSLTRTLLLPTLALILAACTEARSPVAPGDGPETPILPQFSRGPHGPGEAIPLGVSFDANSELESGTFNVASALVQDSNPDRWAIHIRVDELLANSDVESLFDGVVPVADMTMILGDGPDAFVDVDFPGGNPVSQDSSIDVCARVIGPAGTYVGPWTCSHFAAG